MKGFEKDFHANVAYFNKILRVDDSFDLLYRVISMGGRQACVYCVDGFVKDEIMQKLLQHFVGLKPEEMPQDAHGILKKLMPYIEIELYETEEQVIRNVLAGVPCILIEGYEQYVFGVDARTYPARSVDEPEKDKVMRGSRDGFVETLVFNTALIRRRIRDPRLTMQILEAGTSSHTDIVLCYMEDRVEQEFLQQIVKRIKEIKVQSLTMNQQSLAECLYDRSWINPFPKFKFSERPDTAAASIYEGNIVVLVDNSPAAMILPTTIFDIIEEADDYYFPPITGTYLRFTRFAANLLALLFTPFFLLLMQHQEWVPEAFQFIIVKDVINVPLVYQFLILELALDGMRLAALNTPSMLSMPLSVIAGIVIGDFAVSSGWFNPEVMLYMSFVAIASYTQASYELGYAMKFMRMILLILTAAFDVWGFVAGVLLEILTISLNKTIAGKSYLSPLIPFKPGKFFRHIFRVTLPQSEQKQKTRS